MTTTNKARKMRIAKRAADVAKVIYRARLETRSFTFEAFATDKAEAWGNLVQALNRHGKSRRLPEGWMTDCIGDIQVEPLTLGVAYRDGELI